jgi:RNA polymerase sigma-70 factor (ECF subfamily)
MQIINVSRMETSMNEIAMTRPFSLTADDTLIQAAQQGDADAFAVLIDRYRRLVTGYVYGRVRNRDEAEDIAQDVFVKAWSALDRFRLGESFGAWLMQIARNTSTDALRRKALRRFLPLRPEQIDDSPGPEQLSTHNDRSARLNSALMALPEPQRVAMVMHYISGQTHRQIAEALGVPESTIIGRIAGGLRNLRRRFGSEPERWL